MLEGKGKVYIYKNHCILNLPWKVVSDSQFPYKHTDTVIVKIVSGTDRLEIRRCKPGELENVKGSL